MINKDKTQNNQTIDRIITEEKLEHYLNLTKKAMNKIKYVCPEGTHLDKQAKDFMLMAKSYYNDALHFKKIGDFVRSYGAINYAHAWLDAGARLGLFDVDHDNVLFTVD